MFSSASTPTKSTAKSIFLIKEFHKQVQTPYRHLPFTIRILLENLLRNNKDNCNDHGIESLLSWDPEAKTAQEILFVPARVILQDFTGVPCIADLAAMRDAIVKLGVDPGLVNPSCPVDLVIDHSIQVDHFASENSLSENMKLEFERNKERYEFLRWGQQAFDNFDVIPPGMGIIHQINVEHLAQIVQDRNDSLYFDTVVGTDSHTTMVNGLGVLGWGVGGIEAEAVMLGQPLSMLVPQVVGIHLSGRLPIGTTTTDLVLTLVQKLRQVGVVGKFIEFFGEGLDALSVPDRCVISNMTPEHGATCSFFPVDQNTLDYLRLTGRSENHIKTIENYCKKQHVWRELGSDVNGTQIKYTQTIDFKLGDVLPCISGPKRPQDRILLSEIKSKWQQIKSESIARWRLDPNSKATLCDPHKKKESVLTHGCVVIAAITSCTNTSAPSLMLCAGLLAKKAVEYGLSVKPWVKTSLAPGSHAVTEYLNSAGLMPYLEQLGFYNVGYGCTTCIGNSGPLPDDVANAIDDGNLLACAVLSGNRNFEGRINSRCKANWLVSPPLVIAYALTGTLDFDPTNDPIGHDKNGNPVTLDMLWPTENELATCMKKSLSAKIFKKVYEDIYSGPKQWQDLKFSKGKLFLWDHQSTYIRKPPFLEAFQMRSPNLVMIREARCLAIVEDSVTTDHISPAGNIAKQSPAALYLHDNGVEPENFNSYGSRRGNHEVMMRGTFANIRFRNLMIPDIEGGETVYLPTGKIMTIFDAAKRYHQDKTPLIIIAGKEYGSGSSRDWAAKGPNLLGIQAVLAESFERIHKSNLIGMGILPLQFIGQNAASLGLDGTETYTIECCGKMTIASVFTVKALTTNGTTREFKMRARIDTANELQYYLNGGILPFTMKQMLKQNIHLLP